MIHKNELKYFFPWLSLILVQVNKYKTIIDNQSQNGLLILRVITPYNSYSIFNRIAAQS